MTPLDPKDFISDTANAYKDKQYVDFAGALKYFNEDGSVNFAKYLADTANISLYDPIALDLDGNGKIDTLSLENGVFFDHNGDKISFKSSWVNSSDGILARDIDG
ncbi:MAG: RTX toxin-related calcium-binding protein (peptidase M10 serralysin domains), partial [Candidatus Campylobacter infans]